VTGATTTWTLRRSRAPDLLAATMVSASGGAAMASDGWLWWAGVAALAAGLIALLFSARRHMQMVRLAIGERVRLEPLNPGSPKALSEASLARAHDAPVDGRLDGGSVVTPWLVALRIRGDDGRRADLVLTAGSAPPDELRRLRVRLMTDESLRA
jgi:hypothetical protein